MIGGWKNFFFGCVFTAFLILAPSDGTNCYLFRNKCRMIPGQSIYDESGSVANSVVAPVSLTAGQGYYLYSQCDTSGSVGGITLTILVGSIEIYVATDREPTSTVFDVAGTASDRVQWSFASCQSVNVYIRVIGSGTLFVGSWDNVGADTTSSLLAGYPRVLMLPRSSTAKFETTVRCSNVSNVISTVLSGTQPTMHVTVDGNNVDTTIRDGFASFKLSLNAIGAKAQITVTETNSSAVSLLYREQSTTQKCPAQLASGYPQFDRILHREEQQFYVFQVPSGMSGSIVISLSTTQGDADLYVNPGSLGFYDRTKTETGSAYTWSSAHAGTSSDVVTILPSDDSYIHSGGKYMVTVYGYLAADYTIQVTAGNSVMSLQEGVSVTGTLKRGEYRYYRFFDADPSHDIWMDLLPTGGDADIYIACQLQNTGDDSGFPSIRMGHSNFSSTANYEDTLVIASSDPNSCSYNSPGGATFFIAVYGFSDCSFTLSAMHSNGMRTLTAGVPFIGMVYKRLGQQFSLRVGYEVADLTIQLTPSYGDCDLFVKVNGIASSSSFDYYSIRAGSGMDQVAIPETKICSNCWLGITVYGYETARFTLLAFFTDSNIALSDGTPLKGSVGQSRIQYYTLLVSGDGTVVTTLTMLSGTAPTMYASSLVEMPNATSPSTSVRRYNDVHGIVPILALSGLTAGSHVYVGVEGTVDNATYTIRSHIVSADEDAPPPVLTLLEGVPQADDISIHYRTEWLYYGIQAQAGHESLNLRAISLEGNVDLYITKCTLTSLSLCAIHQLPNSSYYQYSTADLDMDSIKITRNNAVKSYFIVGAKSLTYYAAFQISYGFENTILQLQAGVAVTDHVFEREYDYFSFFMPTGDQILKITLTPVSGDPDVYISTKTRYPSSTNSTWKSFRYGADAIDINTATDANACSHCTYYIAVVGMTEATYSLVVSLQDTQFTLADGIPMSGSLGLLTWSYYTFYDSHGSARDFRVVLTSTSGNADMFITLDGSTPTSMSYDYSSTNWMSDDQVTIKHSDSPYQICLDAGGATSCKFIIGIRGMSFSNEFTITLTSSVSTSLIQLGGTQRGVVAGGEYVFYKLALSQQGSTSPYTLQIRAVPTSGHISVYSSCQYPMPRSNTSSWSLSPADAGRVLEISSLSIVDSGCLRSTPNLYFSVFGDSASSFSVSARIGDNSSVPLLVPSHPTSGSIDARHIDYYYLRPGQSFQDIRLLLTVLQGDVDLYVSSSWDTRPKLVNGQMTSFLLQSATIGGEDLLLNHNLVRSTCNLNSNCYFIVAVYAPSSTSRYILSEQYQDTVVTLTNGVPQRGRVGTGGFDYYKFSLLQKDVDVVFTLSALYGDPDMFIDLAPNRHPTQLNYTWAQMSIGADSITIQYSDIAKHCKPDPTRGRSCDFSIGVYGWRNTSYSISARVNDGFLSPSVLLDQLPISDSVATGSYQYYKYFVSVPPPGEGTKGAPLSIKFILTPTGSGDIDLYLTIAANDSVRPEPGRDRFDYKSAGWSTVVEEIEITYTMTGFCYDCVFYLAAYGFSGGSYSLQATSKGVTVLEDNVAVGGSIVKSKYNYYSYFNADQYAEMTITVTAITGDADLYISKRAQGDDSFSLPSKTNYVWRSLFYGSDTVTIKYDESNFCKDCEYLIAVNGFSNATYTLSVVSNTASIIRLKPNRPQNAQLDFEKRMYFSCEMTTSTADVTISLTSLSTGYADLYVRLVNSSVIASGHPVLPNPNDPRTYTYSTAGSEDSHVYIPGPREENDGVLLITAVALTSLRFVVIVATTNHPVILQLGVPQSHFVADGGNAIFQIFPDPYDDLRVTVTARTGDPDLYISSTSDYPYCAKGSYSWQMTCSNYTWSSRMFSTDQIILSRDYPCSSVLPTTLVQPTCDPLNAFTTGSRLPVFLNIYGYQASKFTILGAAVGQHSSLLPGQPQLSSTSPGYICSDRSEATGACLPSSKVSEKRQVSYFSFQVSAQSPLQHSSNLASINDVIISVMPSCNSTANDSSSSAMMIMSGDVPLSTCYPGCSCAPLKVYVTSCSISSCSELKRKPSEITGQYQASMTVDPTSGSTMLISMDSNQAAFCDPAARNNNEDCMYFVAVSHTLVASSAVFAITGRTPLDVSLIPCDARDYPDKVRLQGMDYIPPNQHPQRRYYEMCSQSGDNPKIQQHQLQVQAGASETLIFEAEQCSGQTTLYACADDNKCAEILPSLSSYGYYADSSKFCRHSWDKHGRDTCIANLPGKKRMTLRLPQVSGNYFVMANGTGRYAFSVRSTVRGLDMAPMLYFGGPQDDRAATIDIQATTGNSVTLHLRQTKVLLPGLTDYVFADLMSYKAYIFTQSAAASVIQPGGVSLESACGVETLSTTLDPKDVTIVPLRVLTADRASTSMTSTVRSLQNGKSYYVAVVATCDSSCLSQLTKQQSLISSRVKLVCGSGGNAAECKPQSITYATASFSTDAKPDSNSNDDTGGGGSSSGGQVAFAFGIVFLVIALLVVVAAGGYWLRSHRILSGVEEEESSSRSMPRLADFIDTSRFMSFVRGSGGGGGSGSGNQREQGMEMSGHAMMDQSWGSGSEHMSTATNDRRTATVSGGYRPPSAASGVGFIDAVNSFGSSVSTSINSALGRNGGSSAVQGAPREFRSYLPVQQQQQHLSPGRRTQQSQQFTLEDDDDEEVQVAL